MSSLPVRKISSTSSLKLQFFDNLLDDKMVLWDYIQENIEPDTTFFAGQIPLWNDTLGENAGRKKVIDLIWALVAKDYVQLEDGTNWPHYFKWKKKEEKEEVVYVKTKRKYNRRVCKTRDSGVSDGGRILDAGEETT